MLVPKLRFKREDGTDYPVWEEQNLLQALIEKKEYNTLSSECPLLTSSRTGLMYQNEYRDNASTSNQSTLFSVVNRGDCTYRHMSDDSIFHFNINTLCDKGLVSKEYPVFTARNEFNLAFVVTHLNSSTRFLEFCRQQKKGGTRTRLYFKTLCNYKMAFPCLEEQQKIADFLSTVDEVIAQSEAEVQNLEQQKKAAMQKIFSQEVRFKCEDGTDYPEWEETTIGEYCDILDNLRKPITKKDREAGIYPYYGSTNIQDYVSGYIFDEPLVLLGEDAAPFMDFRNKPIAQLATGKYWVNNHAHCLRPHGNVVFFYYSVVHKDIRDYINNPERAKLNQEDMVKIPILLPCDEEQQKIADFLSAYDEAIRYAKQELDKWKELKKGLLQQMFV